MTCFEFKCDNGRCMPLNITCNRVNDCGDFSDEMSCGMYCSTCVVGLLLLGSQCEACRGNVTCKSRAGILVGGGFAGGVGVTIIALSAFLLVKKL